MNFLNEMVLILNFMLRQIVVLLKEYLVKMS